MLNHNKGIYETIEELGTKIITCKWCKPNSTGACEGIKCNRAEGYIPRVFFLYPENDSPLDLAVIGSNPGNAKEKELSWYRGIWRRKKNPKDIYRKLVEHWRKFPKAERGDHWRRYYKNLKDFLEASARENILNPKGKLFSEVVFCESKPDLNSIPLDTVRRCTGEFWRKEMLGLLSQCEHVLCLGGKYDTFRYVAALPESSQWKVIGLYNPSGWGWVNFAKYFEKGTKNLKKQICDDLKAWEAKRKPYMVKVTPIGTDPSPTRFCSHG